MSDRLSSRKRWWKSGGAEAFGCLLGIALFWCGLTGAFLGFALVGIGRHFDAQIRFKSTEGTVVASAVEETSGSKSRQYRPRIEYGYEVGGEKFRSERHTFDSSTSSTAWNFSDRVVKDHPPGRRIPVYFDPDRPEVAILDPAIPTRLWFQILFLQPFLTVSAGLIWALASFFPERQRLRRFLAAEPSFPWAVPSWGLMKRSDVSLSIDHRPSLLPKIGGTYVVTSFLTVFLVGLTGLLSDGFFEAPGWAIALGFAASATVATVCGSRQAAKGRKSLEVDRRGRTLTVREAEGTRTFRFDDLRSLQVSRPSRISPKGRREPGDPLLSAVLKQGAPVPLHEFESTWDADEVARRAGEVVANVVGVPFKVNA